MEKFERKGRERRLIDRRTGRQVVTRPPHSDFKWKDGYVLRSVTVEEANSGPARPGAVIGGDAFEWIPIDQIELGEENR